MSTLSVTLGHTVEIGDETMARHTDTVRLVLRLPPRLHRLIVRAAKRGDRSLNTEMVQRLAGSFEMGQRKREQVREMLMRATSLLDDPEDGGRK